MSNIVKIRVTCRNNSDARKCVILDDVPSAICRHNGGKIIIVTVPNEDLARVEKILETSHLITAYDTVE